ncbi:MAG: hypothetical protein AB8B73_13990, partial [Ekhidna sp.]
MKIALNEIWNFLKLVDKNEKGWEYGLCAGIIKVEGIPHATMMQLRNDEEYDTELLPSLFTFREILWQPDVFTEASMSLPSLRILNAFCDEAAEELEQQERAVNAIYIELIKGLGKCCKKAIERLEKDRPDVKKILGNFRTVAFPIVKFFIYHPKNRKDYYNDAVNRLNYSVKIMLTQFYGRYTELKDPYWMVSFSKSKQQKQQEVKASEDTE